MAYIDIGIRVKDYTIAAETLSDHKLRIHKGGTIYGIPLVDTDSVDASPVRISLGLVTNTLTGSSEVTDAHTRDASPTLNYDTDSSVIEVGYEDGDIRRAYFHITDLLTKGYSVNDITEAKLNIYCYNSRYSKNCRVHRCTQSWDYTTLTWNNQPTYTADDVASPGVSDPAWIEADVTDQVKWMITNDTNYGFVMKQNDEAVQGSWDIRMTEYATESLRPRLIVKAYEIKSLAKIT